MPIWPVLMLMIASPAEPAVRTVPMIDPQGASLGQAQLTQGRDGVLIRLEIQGLTPGWHAIHFHAVGRCEGPGFQSAAGHVHGGGDLVHGLLNPQGNDAGDLPNIWADDLGRVRAELYSTYVGLTGGEGRLPLVDEDGSALVIHAQADDHQSQPIGGAGARVACGVIAPPQADAHAGH